ncbi:hypothetical protein F1721_04130 [Saccharopolyspora hirsuta]|uniref:Uncharacterized protein n=1 Tax=Saccharopolyspora hirsuta TaxID=1837 RepID=A0A5M7CBH1_SACHI|nr:hypothetical protein [Saccharopolyspora hirsuta]KAA5837021.1 hypothetical protein F1721_04130 [Saccharopolyspora hirsuta]
MRTHDINVAHRSRSGGVQISSAAPLTPPRRVCTGGEPVRRDDGSVADMPDIAWAILLIGSFLGLALILRVLQRSS